MRGARDPPRTSAGSASKLRLREMGSRYVLIVLYVWLEHHLSRGDYRRPDIASVGRRGREFRARVSSR